MTFPNFTAGPWYWHIDSNGRPSLRTPDRGNLIVMDFGRLGMQAATARFAQWPGIYSGTQRERLGGILYDVSHWTAGDGDINHPDARLIKAAPSLYMALAEARDGLKWYQDRHPESVDGSDDEAMARIETALALVGDLP